MSLFSNLRISTRLSLGFTAVLAFTIVVGVVGINSAAKLAGITVQFHDQLFTVVDNVGKARVALVNLRLASRDLVLAETPEEVAKIEADIEQQEKAYLTFLDVAKAAAGGDTKEFDQSIAAYNSYKAVLVAIATKAKYGNHEQALVLLRRNGTEMALLNADKNQAFAEFAGKKAAAFIASAEATSAKVRSLGVGLLLGSLAVGGLAGFVTSRSITRPIREAKVCMEALSTGNLAVDVPGSDRADEVGDMAKAVLVFKENAIERLRMEDHERAEVEARDLRQRKIDMATKRFDATVVAMLAKIKGAVENLHLSADALSANAQQTQRQSTAVAAATDQATANVETVSSASTELTASIHEISRQMQQSATITGTAATEAHEATRKIDGLVSAVQKIGDVVALINDIAAQTNLLALNATIESARAGEAGKGFAVVAGEVKHLAGQTGRATDEIAQQIATVQEETRAAVGVIGGISGTITRINELATTIAGAVEEQGAATDEIARNVEQASQGTRDVATNITGVAAAAAETGRMAQDVFKSADDLLAESNVLEKAVQDFLGEVREA
ncbi:methyl-accepting chemotaxis protein [Telmatospirillum sp.]|uniref:methyl-accepting chemotaxis protein n=1 Tax=Telmatospirillum sp. TaxID=2079197 RepID=UPI00283D1F5C|nr:methyl-accepting chemotaxis protein [Telmatospirillum sp.]MDR3438318.1 methyl-accepting chemotaxis protein [Telmatospirillum sp.]